VKIYTRTGDKGETGLFGGARVAKSHPRVDAYGEVDELNCALGAARSALAGAEPALDAALDRAQQECFMVGALLATPAEKAGKLAPPFDRGLPPAAVARLESEIDAWDRDLKPLTAFVLPGGTAAGSSLHLARAVCRRTERKAVELAAREPVAEGVVVYLNRLSDWLFTAARWINARQGRSETPWTGLKA
jgi:cob(I)alamin adenosyltransferase